MSHPFASTSRYSLSPTSLSRASQTSGPDPDPHNIQPGDLAARVNSREQQYHHQRGKQNGAGDSNNSPHIHNRRAVDRLDLGLGSLAINPELPVASDDPDVWPPPTPDPSRGGAAAAVQQGIGNEGLFLEPSRNEHVPFSNSGEDRESSICFYAWVPPYLGRGHLLVS